MKTTQAPKTSFTRNPLETIVETFRRDSICSSYLAPMSPARETAIVKVSERERRMKSLPTQFSATIPRRESPLYRANSASIYRSELLALGLIREIAQYRSDIGTSSPGRPHRNLSLEPFSGRFTIRNNGASRKSSENLPRNSWDRSLFVHPGTQPVICAATGCARQPG